MIIGQGGVVNQEQIDKQAIENAERARISGMSKSNLIGEIRREMNTTGKVNHLCYAMGAVLLTVMKQQIGSANDPYCLRRSLRPKTGRQRMKTAGKTAVKA